jgi:hypothetical protein
MTWQQVSVVCALAAGAVQATPRFEFTRLRAHWSGCAHPGLFGEFSQEFEQTGSRLRFRAPEFLVYGVVRIQFAKSN